MESWGAEWFGFGAATALMWRVGTRSGATEREIERKLPGDELVPGATLVMDRAASFDVPPSELWPWIAQIGKGRGGWPSPRRLEELLLRDPSRRPPREIVPELQNLIAGEVHDDYGPGDMQVERVEAPRTLIYRLGPGRRWSWLLHLEPEGEGGTRLIIRLRIPVRSATLVPARLLGGAVDWATVTVLFAGLRERLRGL